MSDLDSSEEARINRQPQHINWWPSLREETLKRGPKVRELEDPHKGKDREGYCNRCALACGTPMSYYEKAKTGRISKRRRKKKGRKSKKSKKSKKRRKKGKGRSRRSKKK